MKKETEYLKNTIILLFGKFSSQLVSFLLLPLYTYKLSTNNYGYIDLVQTYISLIVPILMLQLDSAVFRFLIDVRNEKEEKSKIISSSLICLTSIIIVCIAISYLIKIFIRINYYWLIILNMIALVFNTYFMSIARGNGNNNEYSIASILTAVITLIMNLILILFLNFDAKSILISSIIANVVSGIYICLKERIFEFIHKKYLEKNILKKLLKYSIPMIPNVLSWWVVGLSDRTMISAIIGIAANGIYSVSCKFSNLLNNIFSIFSMSWQETASIHINDKDNDIFFSRMIVNIYIFFVILSCLILCLLPVAFNVIIGNNYAESYNYIPINLLANIFSVMTGLLGGLYIAKKRTKEVAFSTIMSATINIVLNIVFIKKICLYSASISTVIAYLIMLIYRYFDIKKLIDLNIEWNKTIPSFLLLIISGLSYYMKNKYLGVVIAIMTLIYYFVINKDMAKEVFINIKIKRKSKRN